LSKTTHAECYHHFEVDYSAFPLGNTYRLDSDQNILDNKTYKDSGFIQVVLYYKEIELLTFFSYFQILLRLIFLVVLLIPKIELKQKTMATNKLTLFIAVDSILTVLLMIFKYTDETSFTEQLYFNLYTISFCLVYIVLFIKKYLKLINLIYFDLFVRFSIITHYTITRSDKFIPFLFRYTIICSILFTLYYCVARYYKKTFSYSPKIRLPNILKGDIFHTGKSNESPIHLEHTVPDSEASSKQNTEISAVIGSFFKILISVSTLTFVGVALFLFILYIEISPFTKSERFKLCNSKQNDIIFDFSLDNIHGIYSHTVERFYTSFKPNHKNDVYACIFNKDSSPGYLRCNQSRGMVSPIKMEGLWRLTNRAYVVKEYSLTRFGKPSIYYIGVSNGNLTGYLPLHQFEGTQKHYDFNDASGNRVKTLTNFKKVACQ